MKKRENTKKRMYRRGEDSDSKGNVEEEEGTTKTRKKLSDIRVVLRVACPQ